MADYSQVESSMARLFDSRVVGHSDEILRPGLSFLEPPEPMFIVLSAVRSGDGDVHVSQVVVPSLERFHLTAYGLPVIPGPRGRPVLDDLNWVSQKRRRSALGRAFGHY